MSKEDKIKIIIDATGCIITELIEMGLMDHDYAKEYIDFLLKGKETDKANAAIELVAMLSNYYCLEGYIYKLWERKFVKCIEPSIFELSFNREMDIFTLKNIQDEQEYDFDTAQEIIQEYVINKENIIKYDIATFDDFCDIRKQIVKYYNLDITYDTSRICINAKYEDAKVAESGDFYRFLRIVAYRNKNMIELKKQLLKNSTE